MLALNKQTMRAFADQIARGHECVCASAECCSAMAESIAQLNKDIARTRDQIADSLRLIKAVNAQLDPTRPRI